MSLKRRQATPPGPAGKISWHGEILSAQPRIQLLRFFDHRSHSYLGEVSHLMGTAADAGGSWQVGVGWEEVLPVYFGCLPATAEPDGYAQVVTGMADDLVRYDRDEFLSKARSVANAAGKKVLR